MTKVRNPETIPSAIYSEPDEEEKVIQTGKILVVDDEKFNCDIIYGLMLVLGLKDRQNLTSFAYNGEQAI
jgi:TRAP-type uncharacterized transport system substrate-binding protein